MSEAENGAARTAPHSIDAEMSVLCSMLLNAESLAEIVHRLEPDDFYRVAHQHIFAAIQSLCESQFEIDHVSLGNELEKIGKLELVGGSEYLFDICDYMPSSASALYHVEIVRGKAILRRLIDAANEVCAKAIDGRVEAMSLLDEAERMVFEIARKGELGEVRGVKEILRQTFERIESAREGHGETTGVPTGFVDLDNLTAGLQPGELVIAAGRPSMGKTSFAINIMEHAAGVGYPCAFFSLETKAEQIMQNLLCCRAKVDAHKLRRRSVSREEFERLQEQADSIYDKGIFIDDSASLTPLQLRAKSRRLVQQHSIKLVIVDYLQLMSTGTRVDSRQQEIALISRSLKGLAKELDIPVIALSQLNRGVEQRDSHRPRMSDLRESGAIEQDADVVMMVHREDYYKETDENRGLADVIVAKQRNGPTGNIKLRFFREFMRFQDYTRELEPIA